MNDSKFYLTTKKGCEKKMTENDPEHMLQTVENVLLDLFKNDDCSEWDCYTCPLKLKEPEVDPRYGRHTCGWLLLISAIRKITRK